MVFLATARVAMASDGPLMTRSVAAAGVEDTTRRSFRTMTMVTTEQSNRGVP